MNITQAKELCDRGIRITHQYFSPHEFVRKKNGQLVDSCGNYLDEEDFWRQRQTKIFQEGWAIVE